MGPLGKPELGLLDFICAAAQNRIRIRALKSALDPLLRRLRAAGLVGADCFEPSPWAMHDWRKRISETPGADAPAGPPASAAREGGGAPTPPPITKKKRAKAKGIFATAETFRPFKANKLKSAGSEPPADPLAGAKRPAGESMAAPESLMRRGQLSEIPAAGHPPERAAPVRQNANPGKRPWQTRRAKGIEKTAQKRVDAGQSVGDVPPGQIRVAMAAIIQREAEADRLADPIEQAKIRLQRRGHIVFSAKISGGPAGHYYVGRRLMSEAEMMAMAARMPK